MELAYRALTGRIIGAFFDVHRELGSGFLESVYETALAIALREAGLAVESQVPVPVAFHGQTVGTFRADLVVAGTVVVEVKAAEMLLRAHEAQLLNYLRATGMEVGLLVNFGTRVEFRRKIMSIASR